MRSRLSPVGLGVAALVCAVLTLAIAGALAPAASAAGNAIINDCDAHGALTHTYTKAQLRQALAVMPPSIKEYTNCYDVISEALFASAGSKSGGTGGSSGGSFLPTSVVVILALLILAGITFGALAVRRRNAEGGAGGSGGSGPGGGGSGGSEGP